MASRAVAIITKARAVIGAVTAIPVQSQELMPWFSIEQGAPGIYLQPSAQLQFSNHAMRGSGPGASSLSFGFDIVVLTGDLSETEPLEDLVAICEAVRLAFETSLETDAAWRGLGACFVEDCTVASVSDVEAIVQVNLSANGFF